MGGSFVSGLVGGAADEAADMNDDDKSSLRKKMDQKKKLKLNNGKPDVPFPGVPGFKRGGKIKGKKGKPVIIKAHAGERVLTAKQQKRMKMKAEKGRMGRKRGGGKKR
jgi:hypothetical protein